MRVGEIIEGTYRVLDRQEAACNRMVAVPIPNWRHIPGWRAYPTYATDEFISEALRRRGCDHLISHERDPFHLRTVTRHGDNPEAVLVIGDEAVRNPWPIQRRAILFHLRACRRLQGRESK